MMDDNLSSIHPGEVLHKLIFFLTLICLILSACVPSSGLKPTGTEAVQVFASPTLTPTPQSTGSLPPSPTHQSTAVRQPTFTKSPERPTSLPTIPTVAPIFDARANVTATIATKAECPKVTSVKNPDLGFLDFSFEKQDNRGNAEENILKFLDQYGADALYQSAKSQGFDDTVFQDLTNDGEPDLAIRATSFYIFGCKGGKYERLFELGPDGLLNPPAITAIQDANKNGIPELTILLGVESQGGRAYGVYEWNGDKFSSLIVSDYLDFSDTGSIFIEVTGKIHYADIDHDLIQELIVDSGIPLWTTYYDGLPWRNKQSIYKWDGKYYSITHSEFDPPEFRFQAVQDADLANSQQEYSKAMDLYQQVIFKSELKDYSPEIRQNLQENWSAHVSNKLTPTPFPADPSEYPRLAAYAYYRMIIHHTFLGEMEAAKVKYATLQEKFPGNSPGYPYTEMASAFWAAYNSTGQIVDACGAAIRYADEHPEILTPLGSDYHGYQSHKYVPADVCLFR